MKSFFLVLAMFETIQIELSLFSIVDIFTFTTAIALALLFFSSKSENKKANLYLALFLLSLSGELLGILSESVMDQESVIFQTSLFTIPLLFFYIRKTINVSIKPLVWFLFLPGLLLNFTIVDLGVTSVFEYLFNFSILLFILKLLRKHKARLNQFYSDFEFKTLKWIKIIVFIYLGFHLLWITEDILVSQIETIELYFAGLSSILTLFMVLWIGHNGFSQPEIFKVKMFQQGSENLSILKEFSEVPAPNEQNGVNVEDAELFETICHHIQTEKLFTNPKLNLSSLASSLDLNEKDLSRLINQQTESNFYQFINQFRVEEFKLLLSTPKAQQWSILGLAEEAGFNSKSTFYTAFKSLEGMTPKQYELSIKQSE